MAGGFEKPIDDSAEPEFTKNAEFVTWNASSSNTNAPGARYDTIVQMLRDRTVWDRAAREKRGRFWYRQSLEDDVGPGGNASSPRSRVRLNKFRTKVPCRVSPAARALLDKLAKQYPDATVTFPQLANGQQIVMLTPGAGAPPRQIGLVEHVVQTDPKLCNVRNQGLAVETDGASMLVLRFRYPPTSVRMSSRHGTARSTGQAASVDFTEIRAALDLRPTEEVSTPRLVRLTRPEAEQMTALGSRDYESFYMRFKLAVQTGIWDSLSRVLASSPDSQWHQGSYYTVVREPDPSSGKIYQKTIDDRGRAVHIGLHRVYDAAVATDILLLYLEGDILADSAEMYFAIHDRSSSAGSFKEEFFTIVRQFWASSPSLVSRYGSDIAAVVRMSQRAVPSPVQAPLLTRDWTNLRQALVDRYGESGWKAAHLVPRKVSGARVGESQTGWSFACFTAGEVNVGLRLVYRQQWRHVGTERGEIIRVARAAAKEPGGGSTRNLAEVLDEAVDAAVDAMKWPLDSDGSINTGVRRLAPRTDLGLESECRGSSRDTSTRLSDIIRAMADDTEAPSSTEIENSVDPDAETYVYSRLHNRYEGLTRLVEMENVVLVAEQLPTPAEIDFFWVRRHAAVLATALLDEALRDTLDTIRQDTWATDEKWGELYEHLRANILHYQRAIWRQEDPQQRSMRYRKLGTKVPLEWRFELESTALAIDELADRLTATNVDGQFAAYSAGREADLDQVIDPAGPIGYHANYAIYRMRPEFGSEDLFSMLHFFKSPYLRPNPETGEPEVADPEEIAITGDLAALDVFRRQRTRCIALQGVAIDVQAERPHGGFGFPAEGFGLILEGGREIAVVATNSHRTPQAEWTIYRGGEEPMLRMLDGAGVFRIPEPVSGAREDECIIRNYPVTR